MHACRSTLEDPTTDPGAKALIALVQTQGDISRLTSGPPNIPAERLATLRAAYKAAMEDKEFLEKTTKMGLPVEPAYGDTVLKMVKDALNQTPETIALLAKALEPAK